MSTARSTRRDGAQYRKAADLAIEQLEWTIGYLDRIKKPKIARALRQNRSRIVTRYRGY